HMENNNHDSLLLKKLVKEWIKTNRNKVNYTQGELNYHSGMDTQTISKIENGRNIPELLTFIHLAIALDLNKCQKFRYVSTVFYRNIPELLTFIHLAIALDLDVNEFIAEYKRNSDFFNRD